MRWVQLRAQNSLFYAVTFIKYFINSCIFKSNPLAEPLEDQYFVLLKWPTDLENIDDIFYNGPHVEERVVDSRELVKAWVDGYKQYVNNTQLLRNPYFKLSRQTEFLYVIMKIFEKWLSMIQLKSQSFFFTVIFHFFS